MNSKRIKVLDRGAPESPGQKLNATHDVSGERPVHCDPSKAVEAESGNSQPERSIASDGKERLAYSVQEAADLLGVHYFSVYRLIQRRKLRACRVLSGKLLIPRSELERLLKT